MNQDETKDTAPPESDPKRVEEFKNQVLSFLTRLSHVAAGAIGKLRIMLGVSVICAVWLAYMVMTLFQLSILSTLPALLGFAFPSILIWKLYRILMDVAGLPEQLPVLADGIRDAYAELRGEGAERLHELTETGEGKSRFKSLFTMGRKLIGIRTLLGSLKARAGQAGRPAVIESVIIVAGPGFVFLMTLATISTVLLVILTLFSLGLYMRLI